MRLIDADDRKLNYELSTYMRETGIDEMPYEYATKAIDDAPTIVAISSKVKQWKDFAVWVANEIFDDTWEYNKDAFAEIACRKLEKLGIVKAIGDEWELADMRGE